VKPVGGIGLSKFCFNHSTDFNLKSIDNGSTSSIDNLNVYEPLSIFLVIIDLSKCKHWVTELNKQAPFPAARTY